MTKLFLYGLGFCCLSIFGLLILDARIAKRRMRQWADKNWNPFFGEEVMPTDRADSIAPSDENNVLPKRRKVFKPVLLITTVATIIFVAVIKRHAAVTHQHRVSVADESVPTQSDNAGNMVSATRDFPAFKMENPSWSFMSAVSMEPLQPENSQDDAIWDAAGWWGKCEWMSGNENSSAAETDFCSSINLGLSTRASAGEIESGAMDLLSQGAPFGYESSGNAVQTESGKRLLNCSLTEVSASASRPLDAGMMIR